MKNQKRSSNRKLPTQFMLLAKGTIGAYLVYMAWMLLGNLMSGKETQVLVFGAFVVLFAAAGTAVVLWSAWDLMRGRYVGGKLDPGPDKAQDEAEALEETEE